MQPFCGRDPGAWLRQHGTIRPAGIIWQTMIFFSFFSKMFKTQTFPEYRVQSPSQPRSLSTKEQILSSLITVSTDWMHSALCGLFNSGFTNTLEGGIISVQWHMIKPRCKEVQQLAPHMQQSWNSKRSLFSSIFLSFSYTLRVTAQLVLM